VPDLPAISEFAPGAAVNGWSAVVAPRATPFDAVARLNHEIAAYLNTMDIQHRLYAFGLASEGAGTPQSAARRPGKVARARDGA
jgi:tripartite-type tricarboxylate transporter receptor subunit TctC